MRAALARLPVLLAVLVAAALAPSLAGCKHEQSYHDGLKIFCDAPDRMPGGRERLTEAILAVEKQVTSREVRADLDKLPTLAGPQKLDALRADMARAKLDRCAVLDVWQEQLAHPPTTAPGDDPLSRPVPPRPN